MGFSKAARDSVPARSEGIHGVVEEVGGRNGMEALAIKAP